MDGLPFLAAVGAALVSVIVLRSAVRRYNIRGRLLGGVALVGAAYVGSLIYFAFGFLFVMIHPDQSQQIWTALEHGFRVSCGIIFAATLAAGNPFRKPIEPVAAEKLPEGNVRDRLLKARANLEARIEQVRSSPVMNYRGGVPETDLIVEELAETLSEIDTALATPENKT